MTNTFKISTSLFCLSAIFSFADSAYTDIPSTENQIEETPISTPVIVPPSIGYQPEKVTTQPKGLITPTVEPRVDQALGFIIDADFIWWKSRVSNFDYAQMNGKVLSPHFKFEPGFKVGTGMDLQHDGWDAYAEYTWLYQPELSTSESFRNLGYSSLIVPFAEDATDGILTSISLMDAASWRKSQFNILDLETGRNFFISKRLTLRPHVGIKAAALFEKTKIIYISPGPIKTVNLLLKQNLVGLGARAGMDTVWRITRDFGLYGDAAFTALWGNFHNTFSNQSKLNGEVVSYPLYKKTQDILPIFEIGIGLTYMAWFKQERYQLYMKAGWEEQIWLSYNKNIVNGLMSTDGALTLHGLTAQLGLAF